MEALGDKDHIKRNQEKYNTIAEKTREMGYKVRRDNRGVYWLYSTFCNQTPCRSCPVADCSPAVNTNMLQNGNGMKQCYSAENMQLKRNGGQRLTTAHLVSVVKVKTLIPELQQAVSDHKRKAAE